MEMMIWNIVLTAVVGLMVFMIKGKFSELERLGAMLSSTREEIARNHVTREEVHRDMEKLMERVDAGIARLEAKLDRLTER